MILFRRCFKHSSQMKKLKPPPPKVSMSSMPQRASRKEQLRQSMPFLTTHKSNAFFFDVISIFFSLESQPEAQGLFLDLHTC